MASNRGCFLKKNSSISVQMEWYNFVVKLYSRHNNVLKSSFFHSSVKYLQALRDDLGDRQ